MCHKASQKFNIQYFTYYTFISHPKHYSWPIFSFIYFCKRWQDKSEKAYESYQNNPTKSISLYTNVITCNHYQRNFSLFSWLWEAFSSISDSQSRKLWLMLLHNLTISLKKNGKLNILPTDEHNKKKSFLVECSMGTSELL